MLTPSRPVDIGFIVGASFDAMVVTTGGIVGIETVYNLYDFEVGTFVYGGPRGATDAGFAGSVYIGGVTGWSTFTDDPGVKNYGGWAATFGGAFSPLVLGGGVDFFAGENAQLRGIDVSFSIGPSLSPIPFSIASGAVYAEFLGGVSFHARGVRRQTMDDAIAFSSYLMTSQASPDFVSFTLRSSMIAIILQNGAAWERQNRSSP
ncbi:MAG: hypothetical protein HC828_05120 [Blastochloris sp.]|nr:hypothetical protein [Blastochloris sp.]